MPRTERIIEEMAAHRARFDTFCRALTVEELATPVPDAPWTVRDYIAHLATVDALLVRFFGPMVGITDTPPLDVPPPTPFDIDEWNEAIVPLREKLSVDELLAEAAKHRANFERILRAIPDDRLDMMIPFGGDRKAIDLPPTQVRLEDLLWSIALHDPNHTRDIVRALPHREGDVREWFESTDFGRVPEEITARRV